MLFKRKLVSQIYIEKAIFFLKALLFENATTIPIPRYQELSTKRVWGFVQELSDLMKYFPNLNQNELPDRSFLWTILGTLRTKECKQLL